MPLIDTPVAELEYAEDGDPAGTPVVLVHGFPDIPATWEQVVPRLPPGLRIIRPYLRGYGGSRVRAEAWDEAGGAQVAALATDLLDLLDALSLDRVVLAGHDWGARTAHAATVLAPERISGLVTMATAYGPLHHLNAAERFTEAERFAMPPRAFIRRCWAEWSPSLLLAETDLQAVLRGTETAQFIEAVVHYYRHGT